jgi:hypothetical protein
MLFCFTPGGKITRNKTLQGGNLNKKNYRECKAKLAYFACGKNLLTLYQNTSVCYLSSGYTPKTCFYNIYYLSSGRHLQNLSKISYSYNILYLSSKRIKHKRCRAHEKINRVTKVNL